MENNFDKILEEALIMREEGKTISEVSDLYPENKPELAEALETAEMVAGLKISATPMKKTLEEMLNNISVTIPGFRRYTYGGEIKGRSSLLKKFGSFADLGGYFPKFLSVSSAVVVVAVILALGYNFNLISPRRSVADQADEIVRDLNKSAEINQETSAQETAEASLINSESANAGDFSQIINENEI